MILKNLFFFKNKRINKNFFKKFLKLSFFLFSLFFIFALFFYFYSIKDLKKNSIENFFSKKGQSHLLLDRDGFFLDQIPNHQNLFGYWEVKDIPPLVKLSHLAAEDVYFDSHLGVYLPSVFRAIYQNYKEGKVISGASTIAMQVARMIRNKRASNFLEKLEEMMIAVHITLKYGREKILKSYLQMAPYGNRIYGISCATQIYFDKSIKDLSFAEAIFLAAIPQNPNKMNIYSYKGREHIRKRGILILKRLRDKKKITKSVYRNTLIGFYKINVEKKNYRHQSIIHVGHQLKKNLKNKTVSKNIYSLSLDLKLQKKVNQICNIFIKKYRRRAAENISVIVADTKKQSILCYIGSANYFDEKNHGAIDYAQIYRSTGSTLKPFIYGLGMAKNNFTAATLLPDINSSFLSQKGFFFPSNFDNIFFGPVLYRKSLANSRNISSILLAEKIGLYSVYDFFRELKIINQHNDLGADYYGLSMATGGVYCSLENLINAYGILANEGRNFEVSWFKKNNVKKQQQILKKDSAKMIANILADPIARVPTFRRKGSLEYSFPISLKTGTSKGLRDARIMAYDKNYVIGVWIGNADNLKMNGVNGGNSAAYVLREIVSLLYPEKVKQTRGQNYSDYQIPKNYIAKKICAINGSLANENTGEVIVEYFAHGTEPKHAIDAYKIVEVDIRSGQIVTKKNKVPRRFLKKKKLLNLPHFFSEWGNENDISFHKELKQSYSNYSLFYNIDKRFLQNSLKSNLKIKYPPDNSILYYDDSSAFQTIGLKAVVSGDSTSQLLWLVNGKPNKVLDYPNEFRWKIKKGIYNFQVQIPYTKKKSPKITVHVK